MMQPGERVNVKKCRNNLILIWSGLLLCMTGCGKGEAENWKEDVTQEIIEAPETGILEASASIWEIPVDFYFGGETGLYSLTLAKEEDSGECELRLYNETGEIIQRVSGGELAEPIQFSFDALCGWEDLEIFSADSSTGLFLEWDGERFWENVIEIPKYTEVRKKAMLITEEEDGYQAKKILQINEKRKCAEEVCGWRLQKDTGTLEIWNYLDNQCLFSGTVSINQDGTLVNEAYYNTLLWDSVYWRYDQEATSVRTWVDGPRIESMEDSETIENFERMQNIVFGHEGHTEEYESREALLADFGFQDSVPMYQYYDENHNLQLELYRSEDTEQFCGIVYRYYIDSECKKWAELYGFTINSVQKQTWMGNDAFSMKTIYEEKLSGSEDDYKVKMEYTSDGLLAYFQFQKMMEREQESGDLPTQQELCTIVKIDFLYRNDGTLFFRDYWHDPYVFGTTLCGMESFYDESGRVIYENGYITHGDLEYYYIYEDEGEIPAYCLMIDHNMGYAIPGIVQFCSASAAGSAKIPAAGGR